MLCSLQHFSPQQKCWHFAEGAHPHLWLSRIGRRSGSRLRSFPVFWGSTSFKAVLARCLQTRVCHYDRCEVGNEARLLGAVCADGFCAALFPWRACRTGGKHSFGRGQKHVMSHNSYWIPNCMIAKETVPPVATVTGNLHFCFPFLRVVCNASVAVGRSRKTSIQPRFSSYWN